MLTQEKIKKLLAKPSMNFKLLAPRIKQIVREMRRENCNTAASMIERLLDEAIKARNGKKL